MQTLRLVTESLQQVCGLANGPFRLLQHIEQEAKFAQKTTLVNTCGCCVLQRQVPDDGCEV
jgi:hypothetical protein